MKRRIHFSIDRVKPWLESVQAVVTILGIIVGGVWTYRIFVMQREVHAHATIAATISRVALTDKANLVPSYGVPHGYRSDRNIGSQVLI